jgi:hypothetical protein
MEDDEPDGTQTPEWYALKLREFRAEAYRRHLAEPYIGSPEEQEDRLRGETGWPNPT